MKNLVDFGNPFAIVGALFLLVVAVLAVWGLVRSRSAARRAAAAPPDDPAPSQEELEYLDSSHIISSPLIGRDPRARGAPPATDAKRR